MSEPTPELDPKLSLIAHLNGILEQIRTTFEQENVVLPERQYIHFGGRGDTAHDCDQLTVSFEQMYSGAPGDQEQFPGGCELPRSAVVVVELVRQIPAIGGNNRSRPLTTIPSAAEITTSAEQQLIDSWLLSQAGLAFADNQVPGVGKYLGALVDVTAGVPSGAYQASVMTIIAAVA